MDQLLNSSLYLYSGMKIDRLIGSGEIFLNDKQYCRRCSVCRKTRVFSSSASVLRSSNNLCSSCALRGRAPFNKRTSNQTNIYKEILLPLVSSGQIDKFDMYNVLLWSKKPARFKQQFKNHDLAIHPLAYRALEQVIY